MVFSPESAGISSASIETLLRELNGHNLAMHSVLIARHGKILYEGYWKPFNASTLHRMNSITKSFVGIAIGLLEEEGKLSLEDKVAAYFPDKLPVDCPDQLPEYVRKLTLRNLLTMRTAMQPDSRHWVRDHVKDRIEDYFTSKHVRPADTLFWYDSAGSYLLCVIVEKLTGQPFLEYLKDKVLRKIGFSENSVCIKGNDGYSWGDSGLLCTSRDLYLFATFLMNGGVWNGERLMNEAFIKIATSRIGSSNVSGWEAYNTFGYGYQIWKTWDDGFQFSGMGDQLMVCLPDKEFIFVCTADNQGCNWSRAIIMDSLNRNLRCTMQEEALPENAEACRSLAEYTQTLSLVSLQGDMKSPYAEILNGKKIVFDDNPMGLLWCRFTFQDTEGIMEYENATGVKTLPFGFGHNTIATFPEEGYHDMAVADFTPGNYYPCATSAAWQEERRLAIKTFMIGKHLGALYITIGFREDGKVGLNMARNTNVFLAQYNGYAGGKLE